MVVGSTGVKIYGEGEWKVRMHGVGKRRTWRKVHLAVGTHRPRTSSALRSPRWTVSIQRIQLRRIEALPDQRQAGVGSQMAVRLFQLESGHGGLGELKINNNACNIDML